MVNNKNIITGSLYYLKVFRKYLGFRIYLVLALTLFAALAEGFGFTLIMPLFQELEDASLGEPSGIRKQLQSFLLFFGWNDSVAMIILLIAIAFVMKGLLMFAATGFGAYLKAILLQEIKSNLFKNYSNMNYGYYSGRDTGHFINIINQQTFVMLRSFGSLIEMCSQVVLGFTYIALAFAVTWSFGLMAVILGILILVIFRSLNSYIAFLSIKTGIEEGNQSKIMIQYLHAFKYLVSTSQSNSIGLMFNESLKRLISFEMRRGIIEKLTEAGREPFAVVSIMGILYVQLVYLEQSITPLIVSILLFYRGLNSVYAVQKMWQKTLQAVGGIKLVSDEYESLAENKSIDGDARLEDFKESIRFENVTFGYEKSSENVLSNINVNFPVKTSTALIGKSGSGKSTMVDLISLMLKPTSGSIFIDNVNSSNIKKSSWRKQIGYVSQDAVIFDDTIANNICMWDGNPLKDNNLMERIKEAASQAYIAEFINSLENGYHTQVGDRGIRLSGGQRQRLFIARELFRKPNVLILDEATSALDSESEEYVKQSVDNLKGKVTIIMIAHRLSTIKDVDYLYVLDDGEVIEEGTYDTLSLNKKSKLSFMINKQML